MKRVFNHKQKKTFFFWKAKVNSVLLRYLVLSKTKVFHGVLRGPGFQIPPGPIAYWVWQFSWAASSLKFISSHYSKVIHRTPSHGNAGAHAHLQVNWTRVWISTKTPVNSHTQNFQAHFYLTQCLSKHGLQSSNSHSSTWEAVRNANSPAWPWPH